MIINIAVTIIITQQIVQQYEGQRAHPEGEEARGVARVIAGHSLRGQPILDIHVCVYLYIYIYIYISISRPRGDRKFGGCFVWVAWAASSV